MMAGPLLCTGGSRVLREVVLDVVVVVQLFAVREEKMLVSLEVLLLSGRRVVAGAIASGSCITGGVMAGKMGAGVGSGIETLMAGKMGAGVGSGIETLTGSGSEPSGAGCRDALTGRPFCFFVVVAFFRLMVAV